MGVARFVVLTGASGSGKTTIARALADNVDDDVTVFHFDSVGVPSEADMIRLHGSGENWQRDTMREWARRAADVIAGGSSVVLEGQVRRAFIVDACELAAISDPVVVLVDCNDDIRRSRLHHDRGQPELANEDMMRWAALLRREAVAAGDVILDSGSLPVDQATAIVARII